MQRFFAKGIFGGAGFSHAFFGRGGGVSASVFASLNCGPGSGDDLDAVIENRRRVVESLSPGAVLLTLYQIHSPDSVVVAAPWDLGQGPHADAMATNVPGLALGILTADCAPVLLADSQARVVGAAHAGWKGALAGVTDSAILAMEKLGADRRRIVAAIGPCISQANYEVDADFRDRFLEAEPANAQFFVGGAQAHHFQFDLEGFVANRLQSAGVQIVDRMALCTYAREEDFFSFRRATHRGEKDYGRQVSAIALER